MSKLAEKVQQELLRAIDNDAALTARIVKMVNSRLGINYTCSLATGLAMEQMFQATSDVVDRKMREVWTKSTEIAGICHALCRHYTRLAPDQATLAGLVRQIGVLPILTYAEEHNELLADSISLNHAIERIRPDHRRPHPQSVGLPGAPTLAARPAPKGKARGDSSANR